MAKAFEEVVKPRRLIGREVVLVAGGALELGPVERDGVSRPHPLQDVESPVTDVGVHADDPTRGGEHPLKHREGCVEPLVESAVELPENALHFVEDEEIDGLGRLPHP